MLRPSEFRDLVSGRRKGFAASAARLALRLAETPYRAAVGWRNRRYDRGKAETHAISVPVASVGNLTLGGTGKTPMVVWIARWFRAHGVRVAVVSRGYGAEAGSRNDEAMELEQKLPDVPHVQNPDRVAGALMAVEEFDTQLILLDDAFQHRRIARDLDIVLLDALEPFGFGHVFPRGTLREPPASLARAHAVVLTRADMLAADERRRLREEVRRLAPAAAWAEVTHAPRELISSSDQRQPVETLRDLPVAAFCGVGNPAGFRHTLEICGARVIAFREFADHYRYARADVESLDAWARGLEAAAVVCTQKDLVKLGIDRLGGQPLWAVAVDIEFLQGKQELESLLARLLPQEQPPDGE